MSRYQIRQHNQSNAVAMAEASRIFQTTLIPQNPSQYTLKPHPHHFFLPSISKRSTVFHRIRCSVSTAVETAVPWGCDSDSLENASALQDWLSKCGLPPQKMAIRKVDVGERGLVALKNIRKGEKLLFVPPSLFITADSVSFLIFLDFFLIFLIRPFLPWFLHLTELA